MAAWLLMLAVFAGLSMNLVLQLGFGIREIALAEKTAPKRDAAWEGLLPLRLGVFFVSVLLMWLVFSFARSLLPLGFLEYLLVFPVCFMFSSLCEYLWGRHVPKAQGPYNPGNGKAVTGVFGGGVLAGAALFVTLIVASSLVEALVLSLGFTISTLVAVTIIAEIRRRAEMEAVPRWLRGAPLTLIAMGLLSLVFSSAAVMFFEVLGSG